MSEQENNQGGCSGAFGKCCGGSCHTSEEASKPAPAEDAGCCAGNSCAVPPKEQTPQPPPCGCG